jgi:sugar/nucleoside kinase (ribokinase family)
MNTYLGISALLTPDDIDRSVVASAKVVYCEGYLWDVDCAKDAIRFAMDVGRDAGAKVALTLSDSFCVDRHRDEWLELIESRVDIVFANTPEICALYECDFETAIERARGHCEIACVTRSELGSLVVVDDGVIGVDAHPVDHLVDTTGAGDLYAAGFLYGLTHGHDLETCARLGGLAAAEVISHIGARPAYPLVTLRPQVLG